MPNRSRFTPFSRQTSAISFSASAHLAKSLLNLIDLKHIERSALTVTDSTRTTSLSGKNTKSVGVPRCSPPRFKHPANRSVLLVCYKKADTCLDHLPEGDTLVMWRLDRFGRSLKDLVSKIEALDERGVEFASLTKGIDTTTAQGRLAFHLFGVLAEFEREIAQERTMAGLRAERERGRVRG